MLLTFGHGTATAERMTELLQGAGVTVLVDVRTAPASRRHPHVARAELQRWLRTPTLPVGMVRWARLSLLLDQDQPVGAAAATAGLAPKDARKWIRRFLAQGLAGLKDQQRTGRPPVFSPRGRTAPGEDGVRATR